jgi:hypothetical protein
MKSEIPNRSFTAVAIAAVWQPAAATRSLTESVERIQKEVRHEL